MKKNDRLKIILAIGLIASIGLNIYLFSQQDDSKNETRNEAFQKIKNGVTYAYNFGDTLQNNYDDISQTEKHEYLTAMHWSLQLSTHMLEIVEPHDERYKELADLFSIYSNFGSRALVKNEGTSDDKVLELLDVWLKDIHYMNESLQSTNLSAMNYDELKKYWGSLLRNLDYQTEQLKKYKEDF